MINKPVLLLSIVVILPLPTKNRATDANIVTPIIKNRKNRLKTWKTPQELLNTTDKELENQKANKSFQIPKSQLQDNRAQSEKDTIKKARQRFRPYKTSQNLSAFEIEDLLQGNLS